MNDQKQNSKAGYGASPKTAMIGIWSSHKGVAL
jgi:hypothetical protein